MSAIKEPIGILFVIVLLLPFLYLVFNPTLAQTYQYMAIGIVVALFWDRVVMKSSAMFPIERQGTTESRLKVLLHVALIYGTLNILLGYLTKTYTTQSITQLLSTTQPLLKESLELSLTSYGIMIPFLETYLLNIIGLEIVIQILGVSLKSDIWENLRTWKLWVAVLLLGGVAVMYHFQVRQLATIPLIITGIFFIVSSWIVIYYREGIQAIVLHMATNTIAVLAAAGLLSII